MALSITNIFQPEEINQLMDKCHTLGMEFIVDEPIHRVWLVVSDADLLRQKMRMNFVNVFLPIARSRKADRSWKDHEGTFWQGPFLRTSL